jgi:hypothetical protein
MSGKPGAGCQMCESKQFWAKSLGNPVPVSVALVTAQGRFHWEYMDHNDQVWNNLLRDMACERLSWP